MSILNTQRYIDTRNVLTGKDGAFFDDEGNMLATVESFNAQVSNNNGNYQPLGSRSSTAWSAKASSSPAAPSARTPPRSQKGTTHTLSSPLMTSTASKKPIWTISSGSARHHKEVERNVDTEHTEIH